MVLTNGHYRYGGSHILYYSCILQVTLGNFEDCSLSYLIINNIYN